MEDNATGVNLDFWGIFDFNCQLKPFKLAKNKK